MLTVDLNCDMGEGCGNDAAITDYVSSVNIACGFHAGDLATMRATAELAVEKSVAIGAHPGYRDLEGFGRRAMQLSAKEVIELVGEQIESMNEVCRSLGTALHHVKPHGALYNQAASDRELAAAIAESVSRIDRSLILYGLSGSFLIGEADSAGLRTASEVFADRTYQADGSLTPRTQPNALIDDANESVDQVMQMIQSGTVTATDGTTVAIKADTICIHGDGPHALAFAASLRSSLENHGVTVRALGDQ